MCCLQRLILNPAACSSLYVVPDIIRIPSARFLYLFFRRHSDSITTTAPPPSPIVPSHSPFRIGLVLVLPVSCRQAMVHHYTPPNPPLSIRDTQLPSMYTCPQLHQSLMLHDMNCRAPFAQRIQYKSAASILNSLSIIALAVHITPVPILTSQV